MSIPNQAKGQKVKARSMHGGQEIAAMMLMPIMFTVIIKNDWHWHYYTWLPLCFTLTFFKGCPFFSHFHCYITSFCKCEPHSHYIYIYIYIYRCIYSPFNLFFLLLYIGIVKKARLLSVYSRAGR